MGYFWYLALDVLLSADFAPVQTGRK